MSYDYIKRTYGVHPRVGARVQHTVTHRCGTIRREDKGVGHYVQVCFDGDKASLPCHPTELDYNPQEPTNARP
jgi:hypothetical protein